MRGEVRIIKGLDARLTSRQYRNGARENIDYKILTHFHHTNSSHMEHNDTQVTTNQCGVGWWGREQVVTSEVVIVVGACYSELHVDEI
eukprot:535835-Pleurochrysis_carterae.AAC.1